MKTKFTIFFSTCIISINAQTVKFEKSYGGSVDDYATSVQQTSDKGFIMVGTTKSFGNGKEDIYLLKTDSNGTEEWNKTFGGTGVDKGNSVQQTKDDGYIIAGSTASSGAGLSDFYLIKTDNKGVKQWEKTFGKDKQDFAYCVQQTKDDGFIIVGGTQKLFQGSYFFDVYLIKTDADGTKQWEKSFGGDVNDNGYFVRQTNDGGYIVTGNSYSFGDGAGDVYLIKTDDKGTEQWYQTFYNYSGLDQGNSVQQTTDGGYIVAGYTNDAFNINDDTFIIKTDAQGSATWKKKYGTTKIDRANSVQQTNDGGFIISGETQNAGFSDVYVMKMDASGVKEWDKTVGGAKDDKGKSVQQTKDGGYIIAGETKISGANYSDFYLIKIENKSCATFHTASIAASNSTICKGESVTLTAVTNATKASYSWSNNLATKSIAVNPFISATYTVKVIDSVGCSNTSVIKTITVNQLPSQPTITQNANTLASSAAAGNQWYLNGTIIANATSQIYSPTQDGNYTVKVINANGCSVISNAFNYTSGTNGIDEFGISDFGFRIFPNPNNGKFIIEIMNNEQGIMNNGVKIYNVLGQVVYQSEIINPKSERNLFLTIRNNKEISS